MKITPVLVVCALFTMQGNSTANAQTKSATPGPPPLTNSSTARAKARRAIPPPPPISSIRTPRRKRSASHARFNAMHTPGREITGRVDLDGKSVPFYPVTHGVDVVKANSQQSANRSSSLLDAKSVNPAAPKGLK